MTNLARRKFLTLGGSLLGASVLTGCAESLLSSQSPADETSSFATWTNEQRRRNRFVNSVLTTHEGEQVRFYDDLIKDKIVLINFMYTQCQNEGFCPLMTQNLSKVQKQFGDRLGKDVFMYSITLDPEVDTPEKLAIYANHFKAKPGGWRFLTASKETITQVRENLGFRWANPEQDKLKQEHIGIVKYGIEPLERWGTCPALTKPEAIVAYVDWLIPNGKRPTS